MKIAASIFSAFIAGTITASAFVAPSLNAPAAFTRNSQELVKRGKTGLSEKMSDELDIPCDDECAMISYPNLPESVHPGVLSGQAMVDLLEHAKENGTWSFVLLVVCVCLDSNLLHVYSRVHCMRIPTHWIIPAGICFICSSQSCVLHVMDNLQTGAPLQDTHFI